ncbi:unnamed protein product [Brassicogethes aeneus]|uniref:Double jelly roll-like domain-containing protein n=1 Tax=Brassicogethes aeneus TaxID=1431903 RepID=A0A9P0FCH7_BRAAE|nr:unnamed protein product [Brassicogethes aeneus]
MALMFLLDEIRYEMAGVVVDLVRNPGITSLMKGYVSFTEQDCTTKAGEKPQIRLDKIVWKVEHVKVDDELNLQLLSVIDKGRPLTLDHCHIKNFKVHLNSEVYPYDNLNLNKQTTVCPAV